MSHILNMLSMPYYAAFGMAIALWMGARFGISFLRNLQRLPRPPGPKGYPFIGSLLEVPKLHEDPWRVYAQWRKIYGDLIYFEVLGQQFLILGSLEATQDLFERRSTLYSSRPPMQMARDLVGWDFSFSFHVYGQQWRKDRRAFHEYFNSIAVKNYQEALRKETHIFLQLLFNEPERFMYHVRHTFAATVMRVAYGITITPDTDSIYVTAAESALKTLSLVAIPGTFLVDIVPVLKYIPQWLPGAGFKRKAIQWRKELEDFVDLPFNHVKGLMSVGKAEPCLLTKLLEDLPDETDPSRAEEEQRAKYVPANAYAGSDTTVSTVQTFFLAMAMYPEVAKKAQAELDAVVGPSRLPDFSDRPLLPYIDAIAKECMRWKPVANLGLAHMLSENDEYNGYSIPKGTIVIGNVRGILNDPDIFEDPEEFNPDRFIKNGKLDPILCDVSTAVFGFGRRICPGRHFSDQNLFITLASTLAMFDIQAPLDDSGNVLKLEPKYISGMLSHPAPFKCRITPRSSTISQLIQNATDMQ